MARWPKEPQPIGRVARVPGFERYVVSETGVVYDTESERRVRAVRNTGTGYMYVNLWSEREGRQRLLCLHKLVLTTFRGQRPPGLETRHLDGDQTNNALSNLVWGTHQENIDDRTRHGRFAAARRKLTDRDVAEIRAEFAAGTPNMVLADRFNVSRSLISNIIHGKRRAQPAKRGAAA